MHKKKNRKRLTIIILTAIAILVGGYLSINFYFNNKIKNLSNIIPMPIESSKNQIIFDQKKALISDLNKYRQYGEWPIGNVDSIPDRGNPFEEKIVKE